LVSKQDLALREALRLIEPGPVALLSTMYHDHPNLMAASWLIPLGMEPTLIGVAVHPGRLTHEFLTKSEAFSLNIPTADSLNAVHTCGMLSGREKDKWEMTGFTPVEAEIVEAPLVDECVAFIECGVVDRQAWGAHDLFVARVLKVGANAEAFAGHWQVESEAGQILHHLGADQYASLSRAYRATLLEEEED
jgi:flavin reductase (DIM6/NTAB) family NADH-FMN oxidoreductase RutF